MGSVLDARGPRAAVCVLVAVAIWFGFAVGFVRGLWHVDDKADVRKPVALDVMLVRLPPPEPPPEPPPPRLQPNARAAQPARVPQAVTASVAQTKPARTARRSIAPTPSATPVEQAIQHTPLPPPTPPAAPATNPTPPAAAATEASTHANAPQPNGPATPTPSATPATQGSSSANAGNGPAHAILQPLPSLPDDLREDAFQAVATARFSVHRDGSVDVELIKPTHNPRLNQLLLDALKKWRFFPAMKNGEAIESTQDIRVHFNVD
jgi:protein TonB